MTNFARGYCDAKNKQTIRDCLGKTKYLLPARGRAIMSLTREGQTLHHEQKPLAGVATCKGLLCSSKTNGLRRKAESRCFALCAVSYSTHLAGLLATATFFEPVIDEQDEQARQHFKNQARKRGTKHFCITPFNRCQYRGAAANTL